MSTLHDYLDNIRTPNFGGEKRKCAESENEKKVLKSCPDVSYSKMTLNLPFKSFQGKKNRFLFVITIAASLEDNFRSQKYGHDGKIQDER